MLADNFTGGMLFDFWVCTSDIFVFLFFFILNEQRKSSKKKNENPMVSLDEKI